MAGRKALVGYPLALVVALFLVLAGLPAYAQGAVPRVGDPADYTPPFALSHPVDGKPGFGDTFGAIRDGGIRLHLGTDISAPHMTPVLAAADGVVSRIHVGEKAGLYVEITHAGGWTTRYLHLDSLAFTTEVVTPEPAEVPVPEEPEPVREEPATESPEDPEAEAPATEEPAAETPEDPEAEAPATEEPDPVEAEEPVAEEGVTESVPEIETEPAPEGEPAEPVEVVIETDIAVGDTVATGDAIGFVGWTGNASPSAPHLHFELRMPDGTNVNPYPALTGRHNDTTLYVVPDITDEPILDGLELVGHVSLTDGFNADVWVDGGIAYLSTFGTDEACPASGVRRYDMTDPADPQELESISTEYPGTATAAVWAGAVETDTFIGTIAAVAHSPCDLEDETAFRGFVLWDVSDPEAPVWLSTYRTGSGTVGIHDLDVWVESDRVLIVASSPNSLLDDEAEIGDLRIVDITDPQRPRAVSDWDFRRDAPETIRDAVLVEADLRDFPVRGITLDPDRSRAFVAQWDAGVVVLDLTDPSEPEMIGRTGTLGHSEGNADSTAFDSETQVLVVNHLDLNPLEEELNEPSWGTSVLFDASGGNDPLLASLYAIEDALPTAEGRIVLDGLYAAGDAVVDGHYLYATWISGGLRVVDLSDPSEPEEVASFVAPTKVDPQRHFASPSGNIGMPLVWSVFVVDDLIYVSDLNTGLWILRYEPPVEEEPEPVEPVTPQEIRMR